MFSLVTRRYRHYGLLALLCLGTAAVWISGFERIRFDMANAVIMYDNSQKSSSCWISSGEIRNIDAVGGSITVKRLHPGKSYAHCDISLDGITKNMALKFASNLVLHTSIPQLDTQSAKVFIGFLDRQKKILRYRTARVIDEKSSGFAENTPLPIEPGSHYVRIAVHQQENINHFTLNQFSLQGLPPNKFYLLIVGMVIAIWLAALILATRCLAQVTSLIVLLAGVLLFMPFVLAFTVSAETLVSLFQAAQQPGDNPQAVPQRLRSIVFNTGHFIVFFVLAFILTRSARKLDIAPLHIVAILLCLALASEGLQLHFPDRDPNITDLFIDIGGLLFGFMVSQLIYGSSRKKALQNSQRQ